MITPMIFYTIITIVYLAYSYNSIPIGSNIFLKILLIVSVIIAYVSEENLRDKVKHLEEEIKNLKKGGGQE